MPIVQRKVHVIDAAERPLGRLASEIARLLQGKHKVSYMPNTDIGDAVEILNIKKIKFTGKKLEQKIYYRHSGYLGGLKETKAQTIFAEKPAEILRMAVKNMLPKNRLLVARMKRLIIK